MVKMEKFSEFITEEKDEPYNVLIIQNDTEDDPAKTGFEILKVAKNKGFSASTFELDGGYMITNDKGKKTAFNYIKDAKKAAEKQNQGDYEKKGFPIDAENTLIFVRAPIGNRRAWGDMCTQLERSGFCLINTRHCHEVCADKYYTSLFLAEAGLNQPKSVILSHVGGSQKALELLDLKFPLILKTQIGSFGIGVLFIESERNLTASVQLLYKLDENIGLILQEYIPTKYDVRVHVLHNEIIASIKRPVIEGDFRSNISQGSEPSLIKLTDIEKEDCIKAAQATDGLWVGVDFIPATNREKEQPFIIEVNSLPGSGQIDDVNDIDLIDIVLEYYMDRNKWLKPKPFRSIYT